MSYERHIAEILSVCFCFLLLLDIGTQFEDVLLAGRLELVGETEIFDLDLWTDRQTVDLMCLFLICQQKLCRIRPIF